MADAAAACWGTGDNGDISTAAEDELRGWTPTEMTHNDGVWHIPSTTAFDENAHWGGPAADEPDGDERHEQGHVRAPSGEVPYDRDWGGLERASDKVAASLRLLHRVCSMVDTSRWWMMKWPVAAVGFLTTALGATSEEGHKYTRRLRAITVKHMGGRWVAQVTMRREADDSEVMEDLQRQWHGAWRFTPRMPTWAAVSKTHVFRIRNLLLKWRRKATATDTRQPTDIGHSGDDHIGNYRAKDIAAKSFLCHGFWTTHKPYVDESDEDELERDTNPERHPNHLRWRWPGRLKEALDTTDRRGRAARAEVGDGQAAGDGRAARRPTRRAAAAPRPRQRSASRRPSGAMPASQHTTERTVASAGRDAPPAPVLPPGSHPAPLPPPEPPPVQHPASLPPPQPPPELGAEEPDDENCTSRNRQETAEFLFREG